MCIIVGLSIRRRRRWVQMAVWRPDDDDDDDELARFDICGTDRYIIMKNERKKRKKIYLYLYINKNKRKLQPAHEDRDRVSFFGLRSAQPRSAEHI